MLADRVGGMGSESSVIIVDVVLAHHVYGKHLTDDECSYIRLLSLRRDSASHFLSIT
jgi:hypothetical protein